MELSCRAFRSMAIDRTGSKELEREPPVFALIWKVSKGQFIGNHKYTKLYHQIESFPSVVPFTKFWDAQFSEHHWSSFGASVVLGLGQPGSSRDHHFVFKRLKVFEPLEISWDGN